MIVDIRITLAYIVHDTGQQRHGRQIVKREQFRAQTVLYVMAVIGDVIGNRRHLRLDRGIGIQAQIGLLLDIGQRDRKNLVRHGAVMLDDALQRFPCHVQAVPAGIFAFQHGDHAQ